MHTNWLIVLIGWLARATLPAATPAPVELMPGVSEVQWGNEPIAIVAPAAIVISEQACQPERVAAQLLAKHVERRFGRKWPVVISKEVPANVRLRILLGQRRTFTELDRMCGEQKL